MQLQLNEVQLRRLQLRFPRQLHQLQLWQLRPGLSFGRSAAYRTLAARHTLGGFHTNPMLGSNTIFGFNVLNPLMSTLDDHSFN